MRYSREILFERHRLSHQQIDVLLNDNKSNEHLKLKLNQLARVRQFLLLSEILEKNRIDYVNLKGPLLSYRIYNDATIRRSKDIDILIDVKAVSEVVAILLHNDFEFVQGYSWPDNEAQQNSILSKFHHLEFKHKELKLLLEVHWRLLNTLPISDTQSEEIVFSNIDTMHFQGKDFKVLTPEFELLYLMIHGARHGWHRLKWLIDIKDYPYQLVNSQVFLQLVQEHKAHRIIDQVDFLLKHFFNLNFPYKVKGAEIKFLKRFPLQEIEKEVKSDPSNKELWTFAKNSFYLFPGLNYKLKIFKQYLLRPEDATKFAGRSTALLLLYRPVSFIKRRILNV